MASSKRVCIFVDGENLRHAIVDLFPYPIFDKKAYLPKTDWSILFDWITKEVAGIDAERIRTYWYVVRGIDYAPNNLKQVCGSGILLEKLLRHNEEWATEMNVATTREKKEQVLHKFADFLYGNKEHMQRRFDGWTNIQDEISQKCDAVEFRRAGAIRFDLIKQDLGMEKAVDVKLATDLIRLKDIYDIAIIVSGDQDYVPAVDAIKDFGKRTVNVAFLASNGQVLPGGARRLNQATDSNIEITHSDLKRYLSL